MSFAARRSPPLRATSVFVLLAALGCTKREAGEACRDNDDCQSGYVCHQVCMTSAQRDKDLRVQSGVSDPPAERPVAAGERVHVRTAKSSTTAFAQCGAAERLIGGGCSGGDDCSSESSCSYLRSYPSVSTDEDSLGGRWNCTGPTGVVQAYALCQETRPAGSGVGSGSGLRPPH